MSVNRRYNTPLEMIKENSERISELERRDATFDYLGIKVTGIADSEENLPDPTELDTGTAYLVSADEQPPYQLFIVTEINSVNEWINIGYFPATTTTIVKDMNGEMIVAVQASPGKDSNTLVIRGSEGELAVNMPSSIQNDTVINKQYADNRYQGKTVHQD